MAYHNKVNAGEDVTHSAQRENDVSNLLNQFPNQGAGNLRGIQPGQFHITVWNNSQETSPLGGAVTIDQDEEVIDGTVILPAKPAEDVDTLYGVTAEVLTPGKIGDVILLGIVEVALAGSIGEDDKYVEPVSSGTGYFRGASAGRAQVLHATADKALVLLGGSSTKYTGSFAVTQKEGKLYVSGGYLNRNGEFFFVDEMQEIEPETGTLCLCSTIEADDGEWTEPEYKITEPAADAYPIAEIGLESRQENGKDKILIHIRQLPVSVAIIMLANPCPYIDMVD